MLVEADALQVERSLVVIRLGKHLLIGFFIDHRQAEIDGFGRLH